MTNSATSTDRRPPDTGAGFQAWHFFILLAMAGATAAVMVSQNTHPAALLLLSAAVVGAGFVGIAVNRAIAGFFNRDGEAPPVTAAARDELAREKALVLRSIKELEFDKAMKKVSDEDFQAISTKLRAKALVLMQDLDRAEAAAMSAAPAPAAAKTGKTACPACGTRNDPDARFCKSCGAGLTGGSAEATR